MNDKQKLILCVVWTLISIGLYHYICHQEAETLKQLQEIERIWGSVGP